MLLQVFIDAVWGLVLVSKSFIDIWREFLNLMMKISNFACLKVFLRVSINDSGLLNGEIRRSVSSPASICDEWLETSTEIYSPCLDVSTCMRNSIRGVYQRKLPALSYWWVYSKSTIYTRQYPNRRIHSSQSVVLCWNRYW